MLRRMEMDEHNFYRAMGTVGSGSHFIEIGETPEGTYAITAHCGSRNFGQKVWKYWKTVAADHTQCRSTYLDGDNMWLHHRHMVIARAYAEYNPMVIQGMAFDVIRRVSGISGKIVEQIITHHSQLYRFFDAHDPQRAQWRL